MLMLQFHSLFSLQLVVLAAGTALLIWTKKEEKNLDLNFVKFISYFIIIFTVLNMICTAYRAIQYKSLGYFDIQPPMMAMKSGMMQGSMMQKPMMGSMMGGKAMSNSMMPNK